MNKQKNTSAIDLVWLNTASALYLHEVSFSTRFCPPQQQIIDVITACRALVVSALEERSTSSTTLHLVFVRVLYGCNIKNLICLRALHELLPCVRQLTISTVNFATLLAFFAFSFSTRPPLMRGTGPLPASFVERFFFLL
jgi:hypothetical protein